MTLDAHTVHDTELIQLLTPEGERLDHPDYPLTLSDAQLRDLYRDLVVVRALDREAVALTRQGELGLWPSLLGQEAAQIGSGRALGAGDMVFPTYREHGVAYCRGLPLLNVLKLFRGVDLGAWDPREYGFHLYSIVIGTQTLHATGYAMGIKHDNRHDTGVGDAAIAYFGDGATAQGDVNEAFVWASVHNAPIVFFCQNNQWAISAPTERQTRVPLYRRAQGFGFPGVRVDGNDVLACLAVTRRALDLARTDRGPTLVEAFTYRMDAHTTTDDPTRYRTSAEVEEWRLRDPIARFRAYLSHGGLAAPDFFDETDEHARREASALRAACLALPDPPPAELFDQVYGAPHAILAEEQAAYDSYLAGFR